MPQQANNLISSLYLVSDFNLEGLRRSLGGDTVGSTLRVTTAPFGQVFPALLQDQDALKDAVRVVWTSPEAIIPEFRRALDLHGVDTDRCLAEVDAFASAIIRNDDKFKATLVASWVLPSFQRGYGMLDLRESGLRRLLLRMNLHLAERLDSAHGVYMLDSHAWIESAGERAWNRKLWYLSKTPYVLEVFAVAANEIKAAVAALSGVSRKLLIVDLDDTLWGGAVGDLGWHRITLGGHHYQGEAFVDFQRALKSLTRRGVVLGIVSKNQEELALEAIAHHPEMVLRLEDFVAWRINWKDKAENILDLATTLNLGLQSVVFIDDNPVERARVREALPDVLVPEWPEDKTLFASHLQQLNCFDLPYLTEEDLQRGRMYAAERNRTSVRSSFTSPEEWLRSLHTLVKVEEFSKANQARSTQLLNKTNQMNLRTRRMSETELCEWLASPARKLWTFRVKDRFGDSGIAGLASIEISNKRAEIIDFVLSCRVMGRKIEEVMVATVVQYCRERGLETLSADFVSSDRNKPCLDFWMNSGFLWTQNSRFTWNLAQPYPVPDSVEVVLSRESILSPKPVLPGRPTLLSSSISGPALDHP